MNKEKNFPMTLERLTNLFFLFVIGTTSLIIHQFFTIPEFKFKPNLMFVLFMIFIMSYEFVILFLLNYYIIKGKETLEESYKKNKKKYLYSIAVVLLLTYSVSDALYEKSWLVFFRDVAITILTIFFGPIIIEKIKDKFNHKNESNTKPNP